MDEKLKETKEKSSTLSKIKKVFNLDADPNEQEAKIISILEKAVVEKGTISTYSSLNDVVYLRNKDRKYIIKIDKTSFTLVLEEEDKVLLNVHLPTVIANKCFAVVDRKIDKDIQEIEKDILVEGEKVLDKFNMFLGDVGK